MAMKKGSVVSHLPDFFIAYSYSLAPLIILSQTSTSSFLSAQGNPFHDSTFSSLVIKPYCATLYFGIGIASRMGGSGFPTLLFLGVEENDSQLRTVSLRDYSRQIGKSALALVSPDRNVSYLLPVLVVNQASV